mmetsp:Transcript_1882/g.2574  ORF Transcript_1882/g.2574 Transcript_1882/m.2574 type:complete len:679 (+) Transcript_1882:114-2150(+)
MDSSRQRKQSKMSKENDPKNRKALSIWTVPLKSFGIFYILCFGCLVWFSHFHINRLDPGMGMTAMSENLLAFTQIDFQQYRHGHKWNQSEDYFHLSSFTPSQRANLTNLLKGVSIHSGLVQIPHWITKDDQHDTGLIGNDCTSQSRPFLCGDVNDFQDQLTESEEDSDEIALLTIIMVFHDHADETIATLNSAVEDASAHLRQTEILVVNDASKNKEEAMKVQSQANSYIHTHKNVAVRVQHNHNQPLGVTRCFNLALNMAHGKFALFLQVGIRLLPGAIHRMIATFYSHPNVGVVTPLVVEPDLTTVVSAGGFIGSDGKLWPAAEGRAPCDTTMESMLSLLSGNGLLYPDHLINHVRDVDFAPMAIMMVKTSAFHAVGLFDEEYSHTGDVYQDADLGFLMYEAGYRVLYNPAAMAILDDHYKLLKKGPPSKKAQERFKTKWDAQLLTRELLKDIPEQHPKASLQEGSGNIHVLEVPRLYTFRFLLFCLTKEDLKLPGLMIFIQLLVAMRVWVTLVCAEDMPHEFVEVFRYIGVEVILPEAFKEYPYSMVYSFNVIWSHGPCGESHTFGHTDTFFCSAHPLRPPNNPLSLQHLTNANEPVIKAGLLYADNPFDPRYDGMENKHCQFFRKTGLNYFGRMTSITDMIKALIQLLDDSMQVSGDLAYRYSATRYFQELRRT